MAAPRPPELDYVQRTRSLPVNLLFLMPWMLIYELALIGTNSPVENATAAWLRAGFHGLGREGLVLASLGLAVLLCLLVLSRLREATEDRGVFGGMFVEGICYGAVLGAAATLLAQRLPMERLTELSATTGGMRGAFDQMQSDVQAFGLAVGAGVFEEVVFRGLLLGGLFFVLRHGLGADRVTAGFVAVLVAAYLFSDYHHWGATGEPYAGDVFAFRFHAGILLGVIYVTRGLGIAALAHGFYDVLVILGI